MPRYRPDHITPVLRTLANKTLSNRGFDGNSRFRSPGRGVSEVATILKEFNIELADVPSFLPTDQGRETFRLAHENREDPFSPIEIRNSLLAFSWHKHGEDKYEILAYLS